MKRPPARSRRLRRVLIAAVMVPALSVGFATNAVAAPPPTPTPQPSGHAHGDGQPLPTSPKRPKATPGPALPKRLPAPVVLDRARRAVPTAATPRSQATTAPAPSATAPRAATPSAVPKVISLTATAGATATSTVTSATTDAATAAAAPSTAASATPGAATPSAAAPSAASARVAAAAVAPVTNKVGVRALVIALDGNDYGLPTWKTTLDRTGAAYDVLQAKTTDITADTFLRPDGAGKYNAILLTDAMLLTQDASGNYVSAFTADEWNTLWAYERDFAVRQATLYASYGTFPEDYCLRGGSEGGVGDTPLVASLTATGASFFSDLKSTIQIPITQSYVYRDTLAAGCNAQSMVTAGSSVLGVKTTSTDGRERAALTFTSNQYLMQANLLTYGLFRWASKGVYLGELRHYMNVDVDDWFNTSDEQQVGGTYTTYEMSAHDAYNARTQQQGLNTRWPLTNAFRWTMAFNAETANLTANSTCYPNGTIAQLTSTSKCIRNDVRWLNHTYTHPKMNSTDYATSKAEIQNNLNAATTLGLPLKPTVLKTGEYSGLGTYNPNLNDDVGPPTDYGLAAANVNLLQAAYDVGIRFFHGNMSFVSQQPKCYNCATPFPKTTDNPPGPNVPENVRAALNIVPDWPTNIAYFATTPDEETYFYNQYYGPGGRFPAFATAQTYAQVMANESDQALSHIATGSLYIHTLHIGNLKDYGSGKTLGSDWLDQTFSKYSAFYNVPLLSPDGLALSNYAVGRNAHFAELAGGVDAVYDRTANTVTVKSPVAGSVTMSSAKTTGYQTYGTEYSAVLTLAANTPVTFTPALRS